MEHLLCVSSHRCLSPFVIILVNCPNPGVRSQSKPRKLRLREVQTAVQDHLALDRQPSLDLPRDLPIHACFPLANGQEKLPALSIVHCFSPTPVSNFRLNSTNQTNQKEKKKKNISWLNLSALSLPETRDSFLANLQEVGARRGRRFPPSTLCGQVRGTFLRLAALEAPAPAAAPSPSPGLLAGLRGPRCLSMHLSKRNAPSDPAFASHEF